jgi:hypothetical protein
MDDYRHHVSGFFPHYDKADSTLATLLEHGIPSAQLQIFVAAGQVPPAPTPQKHSIAALQELLVDGAIGTAVGSGLGGLATLGMAAANVSLFIASPLLAPLILLCGGASLGAFVGALLGASSTTDEHPGRFADLIQAAIKAGDVVLVVETYSAKQTAIARDLMAAAVGEYKDLSLA